MTRRTGYAPNDLALAARKAREATAERDELIRQLHAEGNSLRGIAKFAGLSHTAIKKIVERAAGQPPMYATRPLRGRHTEAVIHTPDRPR